MKTISQINRKYLAWPSHILQIFQVFCNKIKMAEKTKWLFAPGCDWHHIGVKIYEKQQIFLYPGCQSCNIKIC